MTTDRGGESVAFGDLLRQHRLAADLTQEELAERAQMSARGISDLERGARTRPQRETRLLLADALDLAGPQRSAFLAAGRSGMSRSLNAAASPRLSAGAQPFARAPLPLPPNPLIGRTAEVATVSALLRDPAVRLLTLTGAGGSGKTRLAIETGRQMHADFPDGVVFVDLAPLTDSVLVPGAIAAALGAREQPGRALTEGIAEALVGRQMLLILDNFEHVLPAARVVSELLAAAPGLKVLATSRARLALTVEQEFPVLPLAVPDPHQNLSLEQMREIDAVRLFVSRARSLKPEFSLVEENASLVAAVCQRLDGLPLALELASARIKLLPLQALLNRLERSLPLLTGGARDLPVRQQTLRNTIAWSFELLSDEDRTLLRRLGVFMGGWTLEAADAVGNLDGTLDALEGMASLVDKSLVLQIEQPDGEPRYAMLETIREFAVEMLRESNEEAKVRDAHAEFFMALGALAEPELTRPNQISWLNLLQAEHPNLRTTLDWLQGQGRLDAALQLAAALRWFWLRRGHVSEGYERLSALLAAQGESHESSPPKPAAVAALLARWRQDRVRAEVLFNLAIAQWRTQDERSGLAMALCGLSDVAVDSGDFDRADALAREALALAHGLDDTWLTALATNHLGNSAAARHDFPLAAPIWEEALRLFLATGDTTYICQLLGNVSWTAFNLGDTARARELYREQLVLATQLGDRWWLAWGVKGVALLAAASGDAMSAARLLGAAAAVRVSLTTPLRPSVQRAHDRAVESIRTELGPAAFTAAWEEGQALSIEQAVYEALEAVLSV